MLLRSQSYRLGGIHKSDRLAAAGDGPDLLKLNQSFSGSQAHVDHEQCLKSLDSSPEPEVFPEAFELSIEHVAIQNRLCMKIVDIFQNAARPSEGALH